ncbi:MAG: hypothetical protein CMH41_10770 [Micrococcales bacterium]|nr:hypothetical protein [Micrococcales bacterium]
MKVAQSTSSGEKAEKKRPNPRFLGYLFAASSASLGGTATYLATAILVASVGNSLQENARNTALVFALNLVATSLILPYATAIARRFGSIPTLYGARTALVVTKAFTGVALIIIGPELAVFFVYAVMIGCFRGLLKPLTPTLLVHYSGWSLDDATATSRRYRGAAAAIGALVAGFATSRIGAEPLFFFGAILGVPVILYLFFRPPEKPLQKPRAVQKPWRNLFTCMRSSSILRSAAWLGVASAILLGPLVTMVVPILNHLGHGESAKAGLVFTLLALGQVLTPIVVRRLELRRVPLVAATRGVQITAIAVLALSTLVLLPDGPDLLLLILCVFVFGAVFFSVSSFLYESATADATEEQESEFLAAYMLVTGLGAPIGTLIWGHALGSVPLEIFFLAVSVVAAVLVPALLRKSLRAAAEASDSAK